MEQYVSELQSRLYLWIRTTGSYDRNGWASCKATNRAVGFIEDLSIDYTIKKPKAYFNFLDANNDIITLWSIQGEPFIEEFYLLNRLALVPNSLKISGEEDIPFNMMLDRAKYVAKINNGTVMSFQKNMGK